MGPHPSEDSHLAWRHMGQDAVERQEPGGRGTLRIPQATPCSARRAAAISRPCLEWRAEPHELLSVLPDPESALLAGQAGAQQALCCRPSVTPKAGLREPCAPSPAQTAFVEQISNPEAVDSCRGPPT